MGISPKASAKYLVVPIVCGLLVGKRPYASWSVIMEISYFVIRHFESEPYRRIADCVAWRQAFKSIMELL